MEKSLKSKVVVITGASAGVGRATAQEFGRAGAKVVMLARNEESLKGAREEVRQDGGEGYFFCVDVSDADAIESVTRTIETTIGPVFVWINNAMNSVFSPVNQMTPAEYKRVTEVTYLGQVYGVLAVLKYMQLRNEGKIVLVGSALAYRGIPLQSAYCAAKHAVQGFFDSLRSELIHDQSKIGITMVQLPALNTTQFGWVKSRLPNKARPMGTVFQPEVAARAIHYAALHDRREIFVALPTFQAIIGNKFFPGLLDRMMAKTGFKGQQTNEPEDPGRLHNLWKPVPGNHSAHGTFGAIAKDTSQTLWFSMHPTVFWSLVLLLLFILLVIII